MYTGTRCSGILGGVGPGSGYKSATMLIVTSTVTEREREGGCGWDHNEGCVVDYVL